MSLDLSEAIEAADRAHCEAQHGGPMEDVDFEAARSRIEEARMSAAVAAAAPLIAAQVRAQIAAEIKASLPEMGPQINVNTYRRGVVDGLLRAVDIAEGES